MYKRESAEISDEKRFQSVKKSGSDDFKPLIANQESKNTRRNTNWDEWTVWRGDIPGLNEMSVRDLNHFLSFFVLKWRRKDGSEYSTATVYQICAGILRYLQDSGVTNFLDNNDKRFYNFRKTLDARMKKNPSSIGIDPT